ncbi:methyltransferase domain-containing protein [Candidatus Pacearchaeota archaeon]|nr:methyltransferase domain-containing protein [Candidatus Pacearchaeota archaeon]
MTRWEEVARNTTWGVYITEIEKRAILKACEFFKEPSTCLEIGCEAGGRWSGLLASLGWNMICTDVAPHMLQICQERIPSAQCILVQPNDTNIPCKTETIKLLLCIEVHPVINSDWFLPEAFRTLSHGGWLIATVSNSLSLRGVFYRTVHKFKKDKTLWGYTHPYYKFRRKITQAGFKVISEEGHCWLPFTRESNSPLVPSLTKLEQLLGLRSISCLSPQIVLTAQKI